jgi:bacterioferritin B
MRISPELNAAFNAQIGRELLSSNQYVNMAADFDDRAMKLLAKLFFEQAAEEREHAMKFVHYLTDVDGKVEIPALEAPRSEFASVEEAIRMAFDWELNITKNINELVDLAIAKKDYAAQEFLKWFVTEQVEEVHTMENLLKVVQMVGERNVIMVEAYLVHNEVAG